MLEYLESSSLAGLKDTARVLEALLPVLVVQDEQLVHANRAALDALGLDSRNGISSVRSVLELFHPEDREALTRDVRSVTAGACASAQGVARRLVDARGRAMRAVDILVPLRWRSRPAVGIGFLELEDPEQGTEPPVPAEPPPPSSRPRVQGRLSPRQREVAELLAQGLSPSDIAARLGISAETARTHAKFVYRRLRITSRVELVRVVLGWQANNVVRA